MDLNIERANDLNNVLQKLVYNSDYDHAYAIGSTVIWLNKECIICNRYRNGILVISPKGNGKLPARYYTARERDVTIKFERKLMPDKH